MSDSESLPSDIEEAATNAASCLVPVKSKEKYKMAFQRFSSWCDEKNVKNITHEKVLLAYFDYLSKQYKSSSLWAFYSMIRTMMKIKKNVDISKYVHLIPFLKRKSEGYRAKKSQIFTKQDIGKFLQEANDDKFLLMKVALIIGVGGACRIQELTNLLLEDVKDQGQFFHVLIPNTKTKISREFFITSGGFDGVNMLELIRKYAALRPNNASSGRFFLGYRNQKCIKLPVGINTFAAIPRNIATFLQLPNPAGFTGHCYRRSSTSLLANSGADLLTVKRHGGWRSNTVAEGYIDTAEENKKQIASKILGDKNTITVRTTASTAVIEKMYQKWLVLL